MCVRDNLNIESIEPLFSPEEIKCRLPLSEQGSARVMKNRRDVEQILDHKSDRMMVIVGPCSIHNVEEALEYAHRLKALSNEVDDRLMLIMRVYFEKPRTITGWKGLIYDPDLDESYKIQKGLEIARKLLLDIDELGLATATEALDPVTTQYIVDLISWSAIGARTTESQTHRQLVSGMSMPVGFKNTTDGSVQVALEAVRSSMHPHAFLGVLESGCSGVFRSKGNQYGHIVLRGGADGPNYGAEHIAFTRELMKKSGVTPSIVVDCSHANSEKQALKQSMVAKDLIGQKSTGEDSIVGLMIESNLEFGAQKVTEFNVPRPGVSITDECLCWSRTEKLIREIYEEMQL